jgi:hypothetical protein
VVGYAGLRLRHETGANAVIVAVATLATGVVLVLFAVDTPATHRRRSRR